MFDKNKLLDKCEAMTLLCTKASTHWSFIKFCFNIPLVITSSAMCIINSISQKTPTPLKFLILLSMLYPY
jgi:hypothetical protein